MLYPDTNITLYYKDNVRRLVSVVRVAQISTPDPQTGVTGYTNIQNSLNDEVSNFERILINTNGFPLGNEMKSFPDGSWQSVSFAGNVLNWRFGLPDDSLWVVGQYADSILICRKTGSDTIIHFSRRVPVVRYRLSLVKGNNSPVNMNIVLSEYGVLESPDFRRQSFWKYSLILTGYKDKMKSFGYQLDRQRFYPAYRPGDLLEYHSYQELNRGITDKFESYTLQKLDSSYGDVQYWTALYRAYYNYPPQNSPDYIIPPPQSVRLGVPMPPEDLPESMSAITGSSIVQPADNLTYYDNPDTLRSGYILGHWGFFDCNSSQARGYSTVSFVPDFGFSASYSYQAVGTDCWGRVHQNTYARVGNKERGLQNQRLFFPPSDEDFPGIKLTAYPNPFSTEITLRDFSFGPNEVFIRILKNTGEPVLTYNSKLPVTIPLYDLASGLYFVSVTDMQRQRTKTTRVFKH